MTQKLVLQLRNARNYWLAGIEGITEEEGEKRFEPMNSISWMVGHLAAFEQRLWVTIAQDKTVSEAVSACAFGKPASTPSMAEMLADFKAIAGAADRYLDTLTDNDMGKFFESGGKKLNENIGTYLLRQTWHYWYHIGESQAIRQLLGHTDLIPFVAGIAPEVAYTPNAAKDLVANMVNGLNNHEIGGMDAYWSDDMHWYGPAGIGTKPSLKAFQEEHQKPFLHAFPNKDANDEIRIAEGDYVAAKGYQQVTHDGSYLGIPATGKDMQIKYMDFWRAEERNGELKLVENWVMIDLLDFLDQAGYDVEKVLKYIGSKPPEYFDSVK